jgi:hypothetical protein
MYWGVEAREKSTISTITIYCYEEIIKNTQQQNSQQATVFLTTVRNVYVISNSAGVTHLLNTVTIMTIVPHHRTTRADSSSGLSQEVSTQTAGGGCHVLFGNHGIT